MNTTTSTVSPLTPDTPANDQAWPRVARRMVQLLQRLQHGSLTVQWPDGQVQAFGDPSGTLHASLHLCNWQALRQVIKSGDIGFAEGYIQGDWRTANLTDLLRVLIVNRRALEDVVYGHWLGRLYYRVRHLLHRNTRRNSAKNIHAHYDLGNDFYRLWLDETMNYSSAWFEGDLNRPLPEAQHAKVRRALQEAGVRAGDRVLEIGCGWGALAEMAGRQLGAHVTGVTLSHEQLRFARERLQSFGLQHNSDLRLQDYRDIQDPPFDAICSIEMVEAVGQEYWPTYFETVQRLLKPGGRACIQSIVIDDALFERYLRSTDFIQQYIFPGGCLPSDSAFRRAAQRAGLRVVNHHAFGADYAETLRRWRQRFHQERDAVHALGFDERFVRIWEFYLCYCEAAFDEGNIDVVQYTLEKPLF